MDAKGGNMIRKLKGKKDKRWYYDVQRKRWIQKRGILMCKLKGWMDKDRHYDMEIKGWMEKVVL